VVVSGLESIAAGGCGSVASKGVKRSENGQALPASAGEEALELEGRTDLFGDQRLAEVPAARQMVRRRVVAGVRMVVEKGCCAPVEDSMDGAVGGAVGSGDEGVG